MLLCRALFWPSASQRVGMRGWPSSLRSRLPRFSLPWTVLSKETPALDVRQPWHDDPYDVPVSLDFVALPLLVVIGLLRVQLCRRYSPLPARRLVDLLRVAGAALGVCLVTEGAEWVAVALDRHRATWTGVTSWQVVVLAVLTAATIGACVLVRRAARLVSPTRASGRRARLAR